MPPNEFYKSQFFQELTDRLGRMETKQDAMQKDIEEIKNQRAWLMGIVAAISFAVSFAWQYFMAKLSSK